MSTKLGCENDEISLAKTLLLAKLHENVKQFQQVEEEAQITTRQRLSRFCVCRKCVYVNTSCGTPPGRVWTTRGGGGGGERIQPNSKSLKLIFKCNILLFVPNLFIYLHYIQFDWNNIPSIIMCTNLQYKNKDFDKM